MYLFKKCQHYLFESTCKIRRICTLKEIVFNLPNVVVFQFLWTRQFPDDAMLNFICDSNTVMFRLSIIILLVSYVKHGQNSQSVNLVTQGVCNNLSTSVAQNLTDFIGNLEM